MRGQLHPEHLWDVAALRHISRHFWIYNGARVRAFDPSEVLAFAPLLRIDRARSHAAFLLGVPLYGMEELIGRRLLLPNKPSPGVNQRKAHLDAALALVDQLIRYPQRQLAHPIKFTEAICYVSGRLKPWRAAIQKMLEGRLGFTVGKENSKGNSSIVKRMVVSMNSISSIIDLSNSYPVEDIERADTWSQQDALECLNANRSVTDPLN